jgi:hypothetical protein
MRRFAGIELLGHDIPDKTTILRFRHLLEEHQLTQQIFAEIRTLLEERRLLLKSGTIVDATIIAAPPSTKNADKARDPEMHQTRKGKEWHFGMKAHVGTDKRGIVHSLSTTPANVADITELPRLLHGQERELLGDQAYWSEFHRQCAKASGIATASTVVARAQKPSPSISASSTAAAPAPGRAVNMPSMWSSDSGASLRCVTADWPRTPPDCSPPSPWRTCICSDDGCSRHRGRVSGESEKRRKDRKSEPDSDADPCFSTSRMIMDPFSISSHPCAAACAEVP